MIADTPKPPYYAVVFTSVLDDGDNGYSVMSDEMLKLASEQEGFLGVESARNEIGLTVSYWQSLESITNWKANMRHKVAQKYGRETWYEKYKVRICLVERDYEF